jgi:hypothetical protein
MCTVHMRTCTLRRRRGKGKEIIGNNKRQERGSNDEDKDNEKMKLLLLFYTQVAISQKRFGHLAVCGRCL